jgi:hypothetical protein
VSLKTSQLKWFLLQYGRIHLVSSALWLATVALNWLSEFTGSMLSCSERWSGGSTLPERKTLWGQEGTHCQSGSG